MSRTHLSLAEIQDRYQRPAIRDLAWLILSPALFTVPLGGYAGFNPQLDQPRTLDWLDGLDRGNEHQNLPQRSQFRRLGLYCEALFEAFFRQCEAQELSPYRFIARNIQLKQNKVTLGELDFLLKDCRSGTVVHVELAAKFFLQSQPQSQTWCDWIGPNGRDRLDLKLSRMAEHQLALPHIPDSQTALKEACENLNCAAPSESFHFIKGALFTHHQSNNKTLPKHANLTQSHGLWITLGQLHALDRSRFYLCEKMAWLAPDEISARPTKIADQGKIAETVRGLSSKEIAIKIQALHERSRQHFKGGVPGAMLVQVDENGDVSRLMVVPDYWPATNSPSRKI